MVGSLECNADYSSDPRSIIFKLIKKKVVMKATLRREKIHVNGIVQGVGFRPFVYRLAQECRLGGYVNNSSDGVLIEVEGAPQALALFHARFHQEAPTMARITEFKVEEMTPVGETAFSIIASRRDALPTTLISPDVSICPDCRRELFDPTDRRYQYPFINCTNCGPRYTIVYGIPYDRPKTSMRVFPMCPACEQEYHDPGNRRFHAQPNACPACGPALTLRDRNGQSVEADAPLRAAVNFLRQGKILAVRGLGGFHLAVDAHNEAAVQELRRRKGRAEKPFAMMAPNLAAIKKFCFVSPQEQALLEQPTRPIVLLRRRDHQLAASVAPNQQYFGFMLPYTPLHELLLHDHLDALIMTSGNFSEEPIAIGNEEALERLAPLADYFLLHNREILQRCDDSIARCVAGEPRMIRRSRGYAPAPVFLSTPLRQRILACGGELKNTIALARDKTVFLSQHIGDLDNPAALAFFENSIAHLQKILEIEPELIAFDLHPEYLSTKWALQQTHVPRLGVQHHHAHLVSVMAENNINEKTIGIILDGTGYGTDGTIWGGEVLIGEARAFERYAWLQPVPLPGGEAAIHQPWRTAISYLAAAYGDKIAELELPVIRRRRQHDLEIILQMIARRFNSPLTSSCGRLFDAVSALLGVREEVTYEAQAAIELEMIVDETHHDIYPQALPERSSGGPIPVAPLIESIVNDLRADITRERIAARFHRTLVELFVAAARAARQATGIQRAGLSGGVFQNVFFFAAMLRRLQEEGFEVITHRQVPMNDGGLALGQVVIADIMTLD
jgi:hydrogenase maturation protein HypF